MSKKGHLHHPNVSGHIITKEWQESLSSIPLHLLPLGEAPALSCEELGSDNERCGTCISACTNIETHI